MQWCCEIVQEKDGKYSARMCMSGSDSSGKWHTPEPVKGIPQNTDYRSLQEAIRRLTGVEILKKKDLIFERVDGKTSAIIDATSRPGDCRVYGKVREGWGPNFT